MCNQMGQRGQSDKKTINNLLRHHYFTVNGFVVICEQISAATRLCLNATC